MESPQSSSPQQTNSSPEARTPTTKKKIKNHPRRFTDEQIKSLESIFKLETKLEPRKKLQIARDLGLQPRQVAIWFQNKRARWKSKQIEQEFKVLKSNYDTLLMQYDDLNREKQSLLIQLKELNDLVGNHNNVSLGDRDAQLKECPNSSSEGMDHNDVMINRNNDEKSNITKYFFDKREDQEIMNLCDEEEEEDISQTWRNISSYQGLFDQSSENSNWWES